MVQALDPLAKTALWTASLRARESERPDRLFDDPLAVALAGDEGPQIMRRFEETVQEGVEDPVLAVRTKFLDDKLRHQADLGIAQFVFVAAGMDTRAFRLDWEPGTIIYELDRPELLQLKDGIVAEAGAQPHCHRVTLGVDLLADWMTPLLMTNFNRGLPTAWLVEGLLYFLDSDERDLLLRELTRLSAPGSWFTADYVSAEILESPQMRAWCDRMAHQGHPWKSGCDDPEQLMTRLGWDTSVTGYGDPGADFGRWGDAHIAPRVTATRGRYLIVARRMGPMTVT